MNTKHLINDQIAHTREAFERHMEAARTAATPDAMIGHAIKAKRCNDRIEALMVALGLMEAAAWMADVQDRVMHSEGF